MAQCLDDLRFGKGSGPDVYLHAHGRKREAKSTLNKASVAWTVIEP